jgi:hypothetical protein
MVWRGRGREGGQGAARPGEGGEFGNNPTICDWEWGFTSLPSGEVNLLGIGDVYLQPLNE